MIDFTLTENDEARLARSYAEARWVRQFVRDADENEAELPPASLPLVRQPPHARLPLDQALLARRA